MIDIAGDFDLDVSLRHYGGDGWTARVVSSAGDETVSAPSLGGVVLAVYAETTRQYHRFRHTP